MIVEDVVSQVCNYVGDIVEAIRNCLVIRSTAVVGCGDLNEIRFNTNKFADYSATKVLKVQITYVVE